MDLDFEEAFRLVDTAIFNKANRHLRDPEVVILQGACEDRTYDQMAETSQYKKNYLMRAVGPKFWKLLSEALGENVSKTNFRAALARKKRSDGQRLPQRTTFVETKVVASPPPPEVFSPTKLAEDLSPDWGEAPDISSFVGRDEELDTLEQWIVQDQCRLVTLLGLNGIGKTSLALELSKQIQEEFEGVIWRSLRQGPPITHLLTDILRTFAGSASLRLPSNPNDLISLLIEVFRNHRCLVVLDNAETILQSGELVGQYREDYQWYGELLRRLGETNHKSCVIITSLEKPREITKLDGKTAPVRSLLLKGLAEDDARGILASKGLAGEKKWKILIQLYQGNPLALKLVATTIEELFNGQVEQFLKRGMLVFGEIYDLLDEPFNRLSEREQEIVYWLAIQNQALSLTELQASCWLPVPERDLFEVVSSLGRRSLIEPSIDSGEPRFSLPDVIRQYAINHLIETFSQEVLGLLKKGSSALDETKLLRSLNLVDALGVSQEKTLTTQIVDRLRTIIRSEAKIIEPLQQIRPNLQDKSSLEIGYASDNILQLLQELNALLPADHELLHKS